MKNLFILLLCFLSINSYAQWEQKKNLDQSGIVSAHQYFSLIINNELYVLTDSTFFKYDKATDTWSYKTMVPGGASNYRIGPAVFAVNGKGYVTGGRIDGGSRTGMVYTNDLWEYDPATDKWVRKADFPAAGRWGAFSFVVNNKAYIGGGEIFPSPMVFTDIWEYDPAINYWQQKANGPYESVVWGMSFTGNNKGYVVGAHVQTDTFVHTFAYDPVANTWAMKANYPSPNDDGFALSIGTDAIAGMGGRLHHYDTNDRTLYRYNVANDAWSLFGIFAGNNRIGPIAAFFADSLYIGAGIIPVSGAPTRFPLDWWKYTGPLNITSKPYDAGKINLFPNPAQDKVSININLKQPMQLSFHITDALGRRIYTSGLSHYPATASTFTLPITLAKGSYYYTVVDDAGNKTAAGQFIMQ